MYTPENETPLDIPVMAGGDQAYPAQMAQQYRQGAATAPNQPPPPRQDMAHTTPPYSPTGADPLDTLSPDERQLADDRLWRAVAKLVTHGTMQEVERQVKPEIEELRQINMDAVDSMYFGELEDLAPNWHVINDNPEFHAWLDEREPYSNVPRQELLESAHLEHDAERVARFFNAFQTSHDTAMFRQKEPWETQSVVEQAADLIGNEDAFPTIVEPPPKKPFNEGMFDQQLRDHKEGMQYKPSRPREPDTEQETWPEEQPAEQQDQRPHQQPNQRLEQRQESQPQSRPQPAITPHRVAGQMPVDRPILSAEQIRQYASDYAKGRYRKRPEEWRQIQANIDHAVRDGRVSGQG